MNNVKIETINFPKLLTSKAELIEIPLLQRDYAQGRNKEDITTIREKLLSDIFDRLRKGKKLKLDFIYGTIENKCFVPLDGQQRLTTLFLLYWYCAIAKNEIDNFHKHCVDEYEKSKFCYTTRPSATDFCDALVIHKNMSGVDITFKENEKLSQKITNSTWYYSVWKHDPTVAGMLVMLDTIHGAYNSKAQDWPYSNLDTIEFEFIDLEEFELTDDLYIKMNARGKQLTSFEKFKAKFEQYIQDEEQNWEENIPQKEYKKKFAYKVDIEWTDLFWRLINDKWEIIKDNEKSKTQRFNDAYMTCITTIAMASIALNKTTDDQKELGKRIQDRLNNPNLVQPSDFDKKERYELLRDALDKYYELGYKALIDIEWWDLLKEKISLFTIFLADQPTYQQRALFYAQTAYLIRASHPKNHDYSNDNDFYCWMRVARNITYAAHREGTADINFINTINILTELLYKMGKKNIYNFLASDEEVDNRTNIEIVKHERRKARILTETNNDLININDRHNIIFELEDINFCRGDINFALYCMDTNEKKIKLSNENTEKLKKIKNTIHKCMNEITGYLRRAVLAMSEEMDAKIKQNKEDRWYFLYRTKFWGNSNPKWGHKHTSFGKDEITKFENRWKEIFQNNEYTKLKWPEEFSAYTFCLIEDLDSLKEFAQSTEKRGRSYEDREYLRELIKRLIANKPIDYNYSLKTLETVVDKLVKTSEFKQSDAWVQELIKNKECLGDSHRYVIPLPGHNNTEILVVINGNDKKFNNRNTRFYIYDLSAHKN